LDVDDYIHKVSQEKFIASNTKFWENTRAELSFIVTKQNSDRIPVALQSYNSPGDWARELFKPSADSKSCSRYHKKNFRLRWGVFGGERHKWGCFWLLLPCRGPQRIGPLLWLKIFRKL